MNNELLKKIFKKCHNTEDYKIICGLTTKMYNLREIESLIAKHSKYSIIGSYIIDSSNFNENNDLNSLKKQLIPITCENDIKDFKELLTKELNILNEVKETNHSILKERIAKYVDNKEKQDKIYKLVVDSINKNNAAKLEAMDYVYLLVDKRKNAIDEIFQINKNFYVVKDRKDILAQLEIKMEENKED